MFILECNNCYSVVNFINKRYTEVKITNVYVDPHTGKTTECEFSEIESTKDVEYECPRCRAVFDSRDEFVKIA